MMHRKFSASLLLFAWVACLDAFVLESPSAIRKLRISSKQFASPENQAIDEARQKVLLDRDGPHFKLDRSTSKIEFGASAKLVTQLNEKGGEESWNEIAEWLKDSKSLAKSIWDPNLITEMGDDVYRLQVMSLQFATLQLKPWVDVKMKTEFFNNDPNKPIFTVQSIRFDPNIQILPGMNVDADSLGIVIEVAGRLVPSKNGKSVTGAITFQNSGSLPMALLLLPDNVLKGASDTINETVANFAIESFQKGAKEMFAQFQAKKKQMQLAS